MGSEADQAPINAAINGDEDQGNNVISDYEKCRQDRIKENLQRMQQLGIFRLSQAFRSTKPNATARKTRKQPRNLSPVDSTPPVRRSSRLQNTTPVSYSELPVGKSARSLDCEEVGSKPEMYTEEQEKLLGSAKTSWTLFVDGYGDDGKRIYDPINGKTCHQCRQKTLGHRTHCNKCNMLHGQLCGDCLYMRYGENVLEANNNPDWTCPVCRGICNCSLCRQAKGWPPTGPLYKKINRLGYESVAHYLIKTRRANTNPENNVPVSAKRSLTFSDTEATSSEMKTSETCDDTDDDMIPKQWRETKKILEHILLNQFSDNIPSVEQHYNDSKWNLGCATEPVPDCSKGKFSSEASDDEPPSQGTLPPEMSPKSKKLKLLTSIVSTN